MNMVQSILDPKRLKNKNIFFTMCKHLDSVKQIIPAATQ